jgi:glycerol-3-phosphate dehydrogenase
METSVIGPRHREASWRLLGERPFDVLVVGGGITGAGVALDATTRGLRTALVEQRDWASGTSSRSSKLVHGGLRYLEQLNFGLVREALRERELMLTKIAPHLVHPVAFLYPLTRRVWERPYVAAGLLLYDTIGGRSSMPRHRYLSHGKSLRLAPALRATALGGAMRYFDAQTDDARYTVTAVRTAAHFGAVVRSSTKVTRLLRDEGRIVGAVVRDVETGEERPVTARAVINCTGVWTDEIQAMAGGQGSFRVRASKGVHIVVPRDRIASDAGLILRTEKSVLFFIPWGNRWIIGTTDTDWRLDPAHPAATRADVEFLLEQANRILEVPLTDDDICGVYAGLRPLLDSDSDDTSTLSREHAVARPQPGLVSVAGGKYTTYRVMAADAVDAAAQDMPFTVTPSITSRIPLLGADGIAGFMNQIGTLASETGVPEWRLRRLFGRYGTMALDVLAIGRDDPTLLQPLQSAEDYLRAELHYAATHEGALHLDDFLTRRTRISIEYEHRGVATAREVANIVAGVLGWNAARIKEEVDAYTERVEAELASQRALDDAAANAARGLAPDSRPLLVS